MNLLYNIAIFLYTLSIKISASWNSKAHKWVDGRKEVFSEIKSKVKQGEKIIWFHCSSLGEFEQARPVMEEFRKQNPEYKLLLTFFSPSGYEVRKDFSGADYVFYLPADTVANAKQFIQLINPALAVFAKYDFWFNYLKELERAEIPVAVFSAVFRKEQYFFKDYGFWFRNILATINTFFVQDENSRKLLKKIGIGNVVVCGDTRYDRVLQNAENAEHFPLLEKFRDENKIMLVAGSTWLEDERLIFQLLRKRKDTLSVRKSEVKLIIAPHETGEKRISKLIEVLEEVELSFVLFSEANEDNISNAEVLVIDSVGFLAQLYQYGDVAYIGGGFGNGIHNILEPAAFSLPVIFGPNYHKFKEATEMINLSMAFSIEKFSSLNSKINDLFFHSDKIISIKSRIAEFMQKKRGATKIVVAGLEKLLPKGK